MSGSMFPKSFAAPVKPLAMASVTEEREGHIIAVYDRVIIIVIRTTITADAIRRAVALSHKIIAERGELASLMIVGPHWKMPGPDVINTAQDTTKVAPAQFVCTANVILGQGFVASTARSMLTMIEKVYARKHRHQETVDDLTRGATWIMTHLNEDMEFRRKLISAAQPFIEFARTA